MTSLLLSSFLLSLLAVLTPLSTATFIRPSDLEALVPNKNKNNQNGSGEWMSINESIEYLPVLHHPSSVQYHKKKRHLEEQEYEEEYEEEEEDTNDDDTFYSFQPFVDGEAEYDEYQQAWRYLGFMIDCNDGVSDNEDDDSSYDGGTGEGCHRYLLWAAYVDLDYEGGGIGEYQYYNLQSSSWNTEPCNYAENSRCAKMDCHLEDTHWSLLGLFKHRSYDDWMEQLFKHEGYCVWNAGQYQFMSNARETWPQGCEYYEMDDGSYIYYDLKPLSGGKMEIGLYTDTRCMEEYEGTMTVEDLLGNILAEGGSGDGGGSQDQRQVDDDMYEPSSLEESLQLWDSSFDTWRICQPCVAYDLNNVGYNADDDASRGSSYNTYNYGYDDDQGNYYDQQDFDCYDDADYTNVNQCMKFMAKTEMNAFTFRDISLASTQGTLVDYVPLAGYTNPTTQGAWSKFVTNTFFVFSMVVLLTGVFMAYKARREFKKIPILFQEPLFARNDNAEMT